MITKKTEANMETTAVAQDKQHLVAQGKNALESITSYLPELLFFLTMKVEDELLLSSKKDKK